MCGWLHHSGRHLVSSCPPFCNFSPSVLAYLLLLKFSWVLWACFAWGEKRKISCTHMIFSYTLHFGMTCQVVVVVFSVCWPDAELLLFTLKDLFWRLKSASWCNKLPAQAQLLTTRTESCWQGVNLSEQFVHIMSSTQVKGCMWFRFYRCAA